MTDYIHTQKRIPPLKELSLNLRIQEETPSTTLVPLETNHPYCPGPTPPELGLPKVVTTQATVYGIDYVKKGVSVAVKECPGCSNIVRFHEYSSRFHNCNNSVLLTLPSCELLLSGLANKTTSGRMLDTLNFFSDNRYHHQTIRRAFHHFLSLTDFGFQFSCYQYGYHPPVLIADANWKLAFDIPCNTYIF
nr:uncharacterized protein LOC129163071 isoform X2 [Nothobranchius furzeri]